MLYIEQLQAILNDSKYLSEEKIKLDKMESELESLVANPNIPYDIFSRLEKDAKEKSESFKKNKSLLESKIVRFSNTIMSSIEKKQKSPKENEQFTHLLIILKVNNLLEHIAPELEALSINPRVFNRFVTTRNALESASKQISTNEFDQQHHQIELQWLHTQLVQAYEKSEDELEKFYSNVQKDPRTNDLLHSLEDQVFLINLFGHRPHHAQDPSRLEDIKVAYAQSALIYYKVAIDNKLQEIYNSDSTYSAAPDSVRDEQRPSFLESQKRQLAQLENLILCQLVTLEGNLTPASRRPAPEIALDIGYVDHLRIRLGDLTTQREKLNDAILQFKNNVTLLLEDEDEKLPIKPIPLRYNKIFKPIDSNAPNINDRFSALFQSIVHSSKVNNANNDQQPSQPKCSPLDTTPPPSPDNLDDVLEPTGKAVLFRKQKLNSPSPSADSPPSSNTPTKPTP